MNYLAQMLRDCSKNKSTTFTQLSFPIIQQIENKIRTKNASLRKKIKQRLIDRQKISRYEQRKQQTNGVIKKESNNSKQEKEIINYIEAYDDQKNVQNYKKSLVQVEDVYLDDKDSEMTFNIYILMRKRKHIFKVQEIKRKMRSKQNLKRMSLKQCDCCQRVGRHRCAHKFCEGKCQKMRKGDKSDYNAPQEFDEELYAVEVAQQMIDEKIKQQNVSLSVVRIVRKEEQALSIPKIDITQKEQLAKEQVEQEILNQRQRISENESKSDISESKRNRVSQIIEDNVNEIIQEVRQEISNQNEQKQVKPQNSIQQKPDLKQSDIV